MSRAAALLLAVSVASWLPGCLSLIDPCPITIGKTTASFLYGKIQRAAQLPNVDLQAPLAVIENPKPLEKVLWSQFCMATPSYTVPRSSLATAGYVDLEGAIWFVDAMAPEGDSNTPFAMRQTNALAELAGAKNPFAGFKNPFAPAEPKQGAGAVGVGVGAGAGAALDTEALALAVARSAGHIYIVVDGESELEAAEAALDALGLPADQPGKDEAVTGPVCVTLFCPECEVRSTAGWETERTQDVKGELTRALVARNGANKCAEMSGDGEGEGGAGGEGEGVIAREDLAELMLQVALRLPRSLDENAPRRRVVKVTPAPVGGAALQERPNEDILTGRTVGTVRSLEWPDALRAFGPTVREY